MPVKKSKPKKKSTGARKGGKPGNQNARKHGLYARNQPKVHTKGEATVELNQIEKRRAIADEVVETLFTRFNHLQDIDQICKCANSLSLAITAANGCDRTLALVSGKVSPINEALDQLFAMENPYDDTTISQ